MPNNYLLWCYFAPFGFYRVWHTPLVAVLVCSKPGAAGQFFNVCCRKHSLWGIGPRWESCSRLQFGRLWHTLWWFPGASNELAGESRIKTIRWKSYPTSIRTTGRRSVFPTFFPMSKGVFCCGYDPQPADWFVGSFICFVPCIAPNLLDRIADKKQSNRVSTRIRFTVGPAGLHCATISVHYFRVLHRLRCPNAHLHWCQLIEPGLHYASFL